MKQTSQMNMQINNLIQMIKYLLMKLILGRRNSLKRMENSNNENNNQCWPRLKQKVHELLKIKQYLKLGILQ
ncbi:hypothetical protein pb186bvf_001588 [Paramecium bursaria]